jgi:hypothetical protein
VIQLMAPPPLSLRASRSVKVASQGHALAEGRLCRLLGSVQFCCLVLVLFMMSTAVGQETTGGLQGTLRDPSGAVVSNAHVELTGSSLVGSKKLDTDSSGYYRFSNLPPGSYTVTVTAEGFSVLKRDGINIEVGHLPTLDFQLKIGNTSTVVEVNGEAPVIDVTTTKTVTNITPDVVAEVPHGISFQSVIQFAPSARNEPLEGNNVVPGTGAGGAVRGGTGGGSSGNTSNGGNFGYQVGGGADSENKYLVDGQDTGNLAGGYSHSDVPFEFVDQVEIKSSGIEAEHGGALGGVVNVIMKRGSNNWHGSLGAQFQSDSFDANLNSPFVRYDPNGAINTATNTDAAAQIYLQKPNHFRYIQPGVTIGGPILKDRIWLFLGFDPKYTTTGTTVNFGLVGGGSGPGGVGNLGPTNFTTDQQTYFGTGRVDASVTQKIRVFTSWLYQYQRESGALVPVGDATTGLVNPSALNPLTNFEHNIGFSAPDQTVNLGVDYAITPKLVATARFGYFFSNYHDFGFPTSGTLFTWLTDGTPLAGVGTGQLGQVSGFFSGPSDPNFTTVNADKHHQLDLDMAWFKGSRFGTHNLKFGYQLNHIRNLVGQHYNEPFVTLNVGQAGTAAPPQFYDPLSQTGLDNCAALVAAGAASDPNGTGGCGGTYGWLNLFDIGTGGVADSYNHGFFAQDAWTIGHGVTINAGLRLEKEFVPAETTANGFPSKPINFGWGDKIAPRLGAAWDVFRDGRMKVFGSYGVFNDQMKLNLAISSFGGQYWNNCYYTLNTTDLSTVKVVFNDATPQRFCSGSVSTGGSFAGGSAPAGLGFIENQNQRQNEGVVNGIKPYRQHESVFGIDYAIKPNLALEARWDRRRLDSVIEDAAIAQNTGAEGFLIVNPGKGVARTFDGFYQTLYGTSSGCTPDSTGTLGYACPNMIPAARSYDGLEVRLTKTASARWFGMFSYTYSNLRGNYSGLTSSDIADGGGGRNAPNNSRSFDEPYFQWDANGRSSSGPLGTDRPNAFKGFAYYRIPWMHGRTSTNIGWFQSLYSGTPKSSYIDVGAAFNAAPFSGGFPVYPEGRGKWANISEVANGAGQMIPTVTSVCNCRTPWYIQSDASLRQEFKVGKNEAQLLTFEANVTNLFNRRAVTAYYSQIDTGFTANSLRPGGLFLFNSGPQGYAAYEHAYDWKSLLASNTGQAGGTPITGNSQYGLPLYWQTGRAMRLAVIFTF